MTGSLAVTLVPSLALPKRPEAPSSIRVDQSRRLPLARLVEARARSTVYGLTAVDVHGRLADRVVVKALGWRPGDPLCLQVTASVIIIVADPGGALTVSGQGRVHLPAAARYASGIKAGDRVLLAAEPGDGLLRVHPLAALDAMITNLSVGADGDAA
jgi:bifunctional DNA-binding transcriptional regulator/antitoxin component of YhaV-PrlF toxin-antitoxin module